MASKTGLEICEDENNMWPDEDEEELELMEQFYQKAEMSMVNT